MKKSVCNVNSYELIGIWYINFNTEVVLLTSRTTTTKQNVSLLEKVENDPSYCEGMIYNFLIGVYSS